MHNDETYRTNLGVYGTMGFKIAGAALRGMRDAYYDGFRRAYATAASVPMRVSGGACADDMYRMAASMFKRIASDQDKAWIVAAFADVARLDDGSACLECGNGHSHAVGCHPWPWGGMLRPWVSGCDASTELAEEVAAGFKARFAEYVEACLAECADGAARVGRAAFPAEELRAFAAAMRGAEYDRTSREWKRVVGSQRDPMATELAGAVAEECAKIDGELNAALRNERASLANAIKAAERRFDAELTAELERLREKSKKRAAELRAEAARRRKSVRAEYGRR